MAYRRPGWDYYPRFRVSAENTASLMTPMADRDEAMGTLDQPGASRSRTRTSGCASYLQQGYFTRVPCALGTMG